MIAGRLATHTQPLAALPRQGLEDASPPRAAVLQPRSQLRRAPASILKAAAAAPASVPRTTRRRGVAFAQHAEQQEREAQQAQLQEREGLRAAEPGFATPRTTTRGRSRSAGSAARDAASGGGDSMSSRGRLLSAAAAAVSYRAEDDVLVPLQGDALGAMLVRRGAACGRTGPALPQLNGGWHALQAARRASSLPHALSGPADAPPPPAHRTRRLRRAS